MKLVIMNFPPFTCFVATDFYLNVQ